MPSLKVHLEFDDYLKEHEIIFEDTFATTVHKRLDKGVKKYGPFHQEDDSWHTEEGIRQWIRNLPANTLQATATDYLRVALGHIALDEMKWRRPELSNDQLIKSAYRSFIQRDYHRKRFLR